MNRREVFLMVLIFIIGAVIIYLLKLSEKKPFPYTKKYLSRPSKNYCEYEKLSTIYKESPFQ